MRSAPRSFAVPLAWVVYTWMGFLFYLFVFSVLSDMGKGTAHIAGLIPQDPERRRFVARSIAMFIGGAAGAVGLTGMYNVARGFKIKRVRVSIAKLPQSVSGYSMVQLTDIHVGPMIGRKFVESMVDKANALNPDMIVITGDLVDGSVKHLRELVEPLRDLKARDGVYFITGNHEYYSGADEWIEHIRTLWIRVLRNERVDVRGMFDLAGVDDRGVADRHPIADDHRPLVQHAVQHAAILDVAVGAHADEVHIAAQHGVHPDAGVLAQGDVADQLRRFVDVARRRDGGTNSFVRAEHGVRR